MSRDEMAFVFEWVTFGVSVETLAAELGMCPSALYERIGAAEARGFAAFRRGRPRNEVRS